MHSFSGDIETALACVEMGLFISFAGMVTFKKSEALRSVAERVPLDRLLIETDAPYLAPVPMRETQRAGLCPAHGRCLAEVLKITPAELADRTAENARRLFPFSDRGSTSAGATR